MSDIFCDAGERAALVNDTAARMGVAAWVIEKDLWVCWTLAQLVKIPGLPALTFKGGTSLSKVHRLIQRFSEDIDLTFSRDGWGFEGERDPLRPDLSGKKRRALVEEIGKHAERLVREVVMPRFGDICRSSLGGGDWTLLIDDTDPQKPLLFTFPAPGATYGYGKPIVKIEFGARGDPWPTTKQVVKPYVEEIHADTASAAIVEVTTLEPHRTFWEKATLLHALHHGTLAKPDKSTARLSRHLYDIHRIWSDPGLKGHLLAEPRLLQAVVQNKQVFFQEGKARYDLVSSFVLNSTPHPELEATLRADYGAMASMFFPNSQVPSFDDLLVSLREIDQAVAAFAD